MKSKNDSENSLAFLKLLFEKAFALKYYYIACIFIFVALAYLMNKYSTRIYEIDSTIGPVQENRSTVLSSNEMFRGLGSYNTGKSIEDAINSLNSFSLVSATISNLNFEVGYFSEKNGLIRQTTELYKNSPVKVDMDKSHVQTLNTRFYIKFLNDSTFQLTANGKESVLYNYIDNVIKNKKATTSIDTVSNFNKTITGRNFKFSVSLNKDFLPSKRGPNDLVYFQFYHTEGLAKQYRSNLKVSPVSVLASIIDLKFTGNNIEKSINFLNAYINAFLEENLAEKNKIAVNTVNFIDSQLSEISDSLAISESKLRNFKTSNQVTDLSFQGQRIYSQLEQIETEKSNLEVQSRYYNYVINYFKTNQNASGVVPPSSANITDPIMNQLVTDLLSLNAERAGIISNNDNEKNIFLNQVDNKIKMQKQTILENVRNNLNTVNISINELNYKAEKLSKDISNLPRTEMNMVNIQRKFNLNDAIFTFLLQKRSEAAIALASNYPDYKVIEPAREITSRITKPKVTINYAIALFIGFIIPSILLIFKNFLNEKIENERDVERLTDRTLFGVIYKNSKKYDSVVAESPRSAIAESFRNLRSSLFLKLKDEKTKVILVTSSQPQDGKSFVSLNLASSIASVGYKTIILDCDFRRPTLHLKLKQDNIDGISGYMLNIADESQIIHKTTVENLYFIPAGPILPNPSELIDAGALDDLITSLKSGFDFVIIDTPPVGLVADSVQLMKYASQILLVTRNKSTRRNMLESALKSLALNKIEKYEIILNDQNIRDSTYSKYSGYYIKE